MRGVTRFLAAFLAVADVLSIPTKTVGKYILKNESVDPYDPVKDWWKNAVLYQIYPRSFKDSDGDGIGDIRGIIEKLDHLSDAGVTATWLSPIFLSPQVDQGYDIQDYRQIQPEYGTKEDLKDLLDKAHELGIKIILDVVPNHTSDLHAWFQLSANRTEGYEDYYVWKNGKDNDETTPPNNWISNFKDSAWEWHEGRQQFYLHQFAIQQPDLNYRNPKVVEEIKDVLRYWLEFGVDGFRIDAVPYLFEDIQLRDEPRSNDPSANPNDYNYLDHIYTADQDETFDMIYQWRAVLDEFSADKDYPRILVTEAYSPPEKIFRYYGDENGTLGAHFTFNFNFITNIHNDFTALDVTESIYDWQNNIPNQYVSNWVLGNHDNHRIASRLGKDMVDIFNMLASILPGVQVTYNGEEIGMEDGEVTCEQGHDPQAIKNCTTFDKTSRDFERTPYQWDSSDNAGFSNNSNTWLPVSEKYKELNLEAQKGDDPKTHYNVYKKSLELKKALSEANDDCLFVITIDSSVVNVIRSTETVEYIHLFNLENEDVHVMPVTTSSGDFKVAVTSVNSNKNIGDDLIRQEVILGPHESVIFASSKNKE